MADGSCVGFVGGNHGNGEAKKRGGGKGRGKAQDHGNFGAHGNLRGSQVHAFGRSHAVFQGHDEGFNWDHAVQRAKAEADAVLDSPEFKKGKNDKEKKEKWRRRTPSPIQAAGMSALNARMSQLCLENQQPGPVVNQQPGPFANLQRLLDEAEAKGE